MIEFCDLAEIRRKIDSHRDKVLLVNHFATWCGGCVDEMPLIVRLHQEMPDVAFLGVTWELFVDHRPHAEVEADLRAFVDEQGIQFPILVYTGTPGELMSALEIEPQTIPHTVVHGPGGGVVSRFTTTLEEPDLPTVRAALQA
ncbi:MAG: TlpA family protein disulfide reductase [Armatimonadetes bacterium]|nr:TlpA family protein disulfide reductase [Armatimonadota bacterium]